MQTTPRTSRELEERPTPLVYGGGFLNKTLVFETLVRVDRAGRPIPGLADSWSTPDSGRTWLVHLRPGARFHDGSPCDAGAVRDHFSRWLGGDEDAFIAAATRIDSVEARDATSLVFHLSEPLALPYDLAIVNPMAVVGPGARRGEESPTLTGTGAFRIEAYEPMRRFEFARWTAFDAAPVACPRFELELCVGASPRDGAALWALERGSVDAVIEDWMPSIPRAKALDLEAKGFVVERERGSAVALLLLNSKRGTFADEKLRRRAAAAIDRERLVREIELGFATPVTGLFAPWVADWPAGVVPSVEARSIGAVVTELPAQAVFVVAESNATHLRMALEIASQLRAASIEVAIDPLAGAELSRRLYAGEYDLALSTTWGVPYDPQTTLYARLGPQPTHPTAVESQPLFQSAALTALVFDYVAAIEPSARAQIARRIQGLLDSEVAFVSLYAPDRIAVRRRQLEGLSLGEHGYEIDTRALRLAR